MSQTGRLGAWALIGIGLAVGAVAGMAAGNLAAGFSIAVALGITFAYAHRPRRRE